jgi:hypothetical protein
MADKPPKFTRFLLSLDTTTLARIRQLAASSDGPGERGVSKLMRQLIHEALESPRWKGKP